MAVPRRDALTAGAAVGAAAVLDGCGLSDQDARGVPQTPRFAHATGHRTTPPASGVPLIGDGSTSDTGPQPHQPTPYRLQPGQAPPQFVVISWDGAGEVTGLNLLSHFRGVAQEVGASMTLFLSGLLFLPRAKKDLYHPPRHRVGASDIGYLTDHDVHATIDNIGKAWLEGHEIGTHFNGHFCGPTGVQQWSPADWTSEIKQAKYFVEHWCTTTEFTDLPPLPFDYEKDSDRHLPRGLSPRLRLQPCTADHRQPFRGLERRHLPEGRRAGHAQDRPISRRTHRVLPAAGGLDRGAAPGRAGQVAHGAVWRQAAGWLGEVSGRLRLSCQPVRTPRAPRLQRIPRPCDPPG